MAAAAELGSVRPDTPQKAATTLLALYNRCGERLQNGNQMNKLLPIAVIALNVTAVTSAVHAATAEDTMTVSATVARTCTVSADPLAFGTVSETGATASSTVAITCTAGSTTDEPTVAFSGGLNLNATSGLRQMVGGDSTTALVPYTLSAASGGTNLTPTTAVATTAADGGTSYSAPVYGSIAAGTYQIGTFSDTVTVTVTYAP